MSNRLYTGDNLYILHGINSESVDLIYLDPPFNSKKMYSAPVGSKSAGASFNDMWKWSDVDKEHLETLVIEYPKLVNFIQSISDLNGKPMMSYITYMIQRIIELHRILKPTGGLYLHCDSTASHYLKLVLDRIFGKDNFRNEIIWHYGGRGAKAISKMFPRNHDVILYYAKTTEHLYQKQHIEEKTLFEDSSYQLDENRKAFRTAPRGDYTDKSIEKLDAEGRIYRTKSGTVRIKYFAKCYDGMYVYEDKLVGDTWNDIADAMHMSKYERTGYPTQKPLKLLERIIKASSREDDLVLDPFCGCATTCVAAQQSNRKWIGIDIEEKSSELLVERLSDDAGMFKDFIHINILKNPNLIPQRTDVIIEEPSASIKDSLYDAQKGECNGCRLSFNTKDLEIDHIIARSKGGGDYYKNYQLLCGNCNRIKGDRPMEYLIMKIKKYQESLKNYITFGE